MSDNPIQREDVERLKDAAEGLLREYETDGKPSMDCWISLRAALASLASPADGVATRPFGDGAARIAWIAAEQELLEEYVRDYEYCGDDNYYTPTKDERDLIADALQGFVAEHDKLLGEHLCAAYPAVREDVLERLCERVFLAGHSEGWTGNQCRRDVQRVDAAKGWALYVSNGALAKALASLNKEPLENRGGSENAG